MLRVHPVFLVVPVLIDYRLDFRIGGIGFTLQAKVVLLRIAPRNILVIKVGADKGGALVAGGDTLDQIQRRQVEPAIIVLRLVLFHPEYGAGYLAGPGEKHQQALIAARDQATARNHSGIFPAHLLRALIGQTDGIVLPLLQTMGVSSPAVRSVAETALGTLPQVYGGAEPQMTPDLARVLERAEERRGEGQPRAAARGEGARLESQLRRYCTYVARRVHYPLSFPWQDQRSL